MVGLSARGYEYLRSGSSGVFPPIFRAGMGKANLDDPPRDRWEPKFQKALHAILLLAHDNIGELTRELSLLFERDQVDQFAEVSSEMGFAIQNGKDKVIEHFGYRDGISQPLFFQSDLRKRHKQWDPSAGPSLVLVKDPLSRSRDACGTYFVFRKLEQNVKKFREREAALASSLKLSAGERGVAGAMTIGRFLAGTPVAQHRDPTDRATNDFVYSDCDPAGNRCPFFAHIRKVNPRNGPEDRARRIARRGITYGNPIWPSADPDTLPETGIGLLFQCCQADLREQFEFLQHCANARDCPTTGAGKDSLIGQSVDGFPDLHFPTSWDSSKRAPFQLHGLVTMKGGEYFFVPSISFLRGLRSGAH